MLSLRLRRNVRFSTRIWTARIERSRRQHVVPTSTFLRVPGPSTLVPSLRRVSRSRLCTHLDAFAAFRGRQSTARLAVHVRHAACSFDGAARRMRAPQPRRWLLVRGRTPELSTNGRSGTTSVRQ
eukprot:scaffold684_cov345-Pavlova_lutheri.AAC.46